jgi:hypothetical protein
MSQPGYSNYRYAVQNATSQERRIESGRLDLFRRGVIAAAIFFGLSGLSTLASCAKQAYESTTQTRHVRPAYSRPRISLMHHDTERATPLPRPGKYDWQYVD